MNGQSHNIGETFGSHTIIDIIYEENKKKYIVKCICGSEKKYIGSILRKKPGCRKCSNNKHIGTKNFKTTFIKFLYTNRFQCKCDCGNNFIGRKRQKSCGCHKEETYIKEAKKIEGTKFFGIKVLKFSHFENIKENARRAVYDIKCICGKISKMSGNRFSIQKTCGCRKNANTARGERQGNCKNDSKTILMIRELFLSGQYTKEELSKIFELKLSFITDIISCKSWKHIIVNPEIINNSPVKDKFNKKIEKIIIGNFYGKWKVIEKSESKHKRAYYLCQCTCGSKHEVAATSLRCGDSTKCYDCNARNFANLNRKNPDQ